MISGRPANDEFAPYAKADIDYVAGDDAVKALALQGREVVALSRRSMKTHPRTSIRAR
jgi:hypothetical protein